MMKSKQKRTVKNPSNSTIQEHPIWRFGNIDRDGPFAFRLSRPDFSHKEVLQKLIDYGNMTWSEIDKQQHDKSRKSKHHYLSIGALSNAAKERIVAKHLEEETDALFSFAFQNKLRIIGFRHGAEFHIIWYDRNHEFCPSSKS